MLSEFHQSYSKLSVIRSRVKDIVKTCMLLLKYNYNITTVLKTFNGSMQYIDTLFSLRVTFQA